MSILFGSLGGTLSQTLVFQQRCATKVRLDRETKRKFQFFFLFLFLQERRVQLEPEVLASVWASDDRRPGYLLATARHDVAFKWSRGGGDHTACVVVWGRRTSPVEAARKSCVADRPIRAPHYCPSRTTHKTNWNFFSFLKGRFLRAVRRAPTVPVLCVRNRLSATLFKQNTPRTAPKRDPGGVRRAFQTLFPTCQCLSINTQENSHG